MNPVLAVAAGAFDSHSETFIRAHASLLAPGATVLICQEGDVPGGCPVYVGMTSPPARGNIRGRLARALRDRMIRRFDPACAILDTRRYGAPGPADIAGLAAFLARHRPRALLAEYGPVGLQVAPACDRAGVPLFVHFHGWDANILGESRVIRRLYRRLFAAARGIVVTTAFLAGRVRALGCPEDKLHVCPCGVDTNAFAPAEGRREPRVLMVSRLIPQKGPEQSVASFAQAARERPSAMLEIIGDGPLRPALEAQAVALGAGGRVVFHGACDHGFVRERLRAAAVFIQHSLTLPRGGVESQGLTILEAMACGVPVVATRHGAITETVEDGVTGVLVAERDTDAMAAAIGRLLDDGDMAAAMGQAGRARVLERYRQDAAIARLRGILGIDGAR